jgi:hypothetical protein
MCLSATQVNASQSCSCPYLPAAPILRTTWSTVRSCRRWPVLQTAAHLHPHQARGTS